MICDKGCDEKVCFREGIVEGGNLGNDTLTGQAGSVNIAKRHRPRFIIRGMASHSSLLSLDPQLQTRVVFWDPSGGSACLLLVL